MAVLRAICIGVLLSTYGVVELVSEVLVSEAPEHSVGATVGSVVVQVSL